MRREVGHVLSRALDFEVEGQSMKGRPKRTWKRLVEKGGMKVGLSRKDALCRSKWSVGVGMIAVDGNLTTLTCWGYYQNLDIGVSLSLWARC